MYVQDRGMREAQPIVCSWAGMENQKSGRTEPVRPTTMTASVKRKLIINLKDKKCQNVKPRVLVNGHDQLKKHRKSAKLP